MIVISPDRLRVPLSLRLFGYRQVLSSGAKRPGRKVDHSPPSNAKGKNDWNYICTLPIWIMTCTWTLPRHLTYDRYQNEIISTKFTTSVYKMQSKSYNCIERWKIKVKFPTRKRKGHATLVFEQKSWGSMEFMRTDKVLTKCKLNIQKLHYKFH